MAFPSGTLAHSPADIVRELLILLGVGTDPDDEDDWPVFWANEPDDPDDVITLYDASGISHGRDMNSGASSRSFGVQARVRGSTSNQAYAKAKEIATAWEERVYAQDVVKGGKTYRVHCMTDVGDPIPLGSEAPSSERKLWTVNALATIRQLT